MPLNFIELVILFSVVAGPVKPMAVISARTGGLPRRERLELVTKAVVVSSAVLFVFALLGERILDFFHVTVPALEIAGGIILFVFALQIVLGESHDDETPPKAIHDLAYYPLAMPMLATPQAIVAIVVIMARVEDWTARAIVLGALGTQMLINFAVLAGVAMSMKPGGDGKSGSKRSEVVLRVVAILLCAFAVELVLLGLGDLGIVERISGGH